MTGHGSDVQGFVDQDVVASRSPARPARLLSIDVLRGVTIGLMIVVNEQSGPAPFTQLAHAAWNGVTLTDLVFPTFLFLVGLTTVLSTKARLARGASRASMFRHIVRRTLLLVLFGFVVNNFPFLHLASARYYGVLPRIGLCYLVVATLTLFQRRWQGKLLVAVGCLAVYWVLMRFVPVPGFGVPTRDVAMNAHDGNLAAWLDRQIFSPSHLYERTRDPEGLLSTLPAIATALFGVLAGTWLQTAATTARKATVLAGSGLLLVAAGLAWNPWFPINKKLWTSSYALFAGGCSLLALAAAIALVDLWRVGRATGETDDPASPAHPALYRPLLVLGTNAILAYLISELGDTLLRVTHLPSGATLRAASWSAVLGAVHSPAWASLLYSLFYLALCWLLVVPFYRKRLFLRV